VALSRLDLTKLPPGAVWRDYVGDIGATEGARWRWYRVGDKWRGDDHHEARWWPPGEDRPEVEVIAVLAPPALDVRAVREATAAAGVARLGAEVQRWALLPEGAIVLDHAGDIAHKWDGRRWLRLAGCWQSSPVGPDSDMSDSGMAPYVVLGYAFAPTAERAADIRALVEDSDRRAASASAPAASGGDGRVRESAPVAVGDEVPSTREVSRADLTAEVARLERERRAPPAAQPSAPKVGDPVEATDEAWEALPIGALVRVPKIEAADRPAVALGAPVETEEAWAALPVGAVVDTRDGSGTLLAVRGPDGWGWALQCQRGGRSDEAVDWRDRRSAEHMQGFCAPRGYPRLVAKIAPGTRGVDFDRALAAQGYQPAIDAGFGSPKPPAPKPRTAAELARAARAERLAAWARSARVGQRVDRPDRLPPGCAALTEGGLRVWIRWPDGALGLERPFPPDYLDRFADLLEDGPLLLLAVGLDAGECSRLASLETYSATAAEARALARQKGAA